MIPKGFMILMARVHVFLYRLTGGKIGGRMVGAPVMLLTSTGRKTGKQRQMPLLFVTHPQGWVIAASSGGTPADPHWWINLKASPKTTIQIMGETHPVTASEVKGKDYDKLWKQLVDLYAGYEEYAARTSRKIPVVLLKKG